jgi:hypothetical protein
MADPNIRIKRSAVPGKKPTVEQLPLGELGLNTYDAQLFAQVNTSGVGIGTTIISLTPWKETFGAESIFYNNSVGIGTDNATENLTVLGNASVSAGVTVGGNLSAESDLYVDNIRRFTDNSTNTKISLESGRVKIFAGNGTVPKINVNGGVGINTSINITGIATFKQTVNIEGDLNVTGDIVYDEISGRNLNIAGISTFDGIINFGASSAISIGGTTGTNGQYLQSTGTGVTWASASSIRSDNTYTATTGQTTITQAYTAGLIDVFVNGVRLHSSEYVASNGTSIVLNEALFGGESIDVISYTASGSVSSVPENDTLDAVTDRGNDTTNDINVGILTSKSGVYVDAIRRYTDNSTNTKITLESGRLKLFAGNGTTPKININGGVGINTSLNVVGISTFNQDVNVGSDQSTGIVLTSPNGTKYRLIVDNLGNLSTTAV